MINAPWSIFYSWSGAYFQEVMISINILINALFICEYFARSYWGKHKYQSNILREDIVCWIVQTSLTFVIYYWNAEYTM